MLSGGPHAPAPPLAPAELMPASLPIRAATLTVAYGETEDRLTLVAADAGGRGVHAALTRRLTERVVNGLAGLLERSSAVAVQAPAEMRDDIILMEHQGALYGRGVDKGADTGAGGNPAAPDGDAAGAAPADLPPPLLLTAVDVTVTPATFEIRMRAGATPLIALSVDRLGAHRIVETLGQRAEAAGWHIALDAAWLDPGHTEIVLN